MLVKFSCNPVVSYSGATADLAADSPTRRGSERAVELVSTHFPFPPLETPPRAMFDDCRHRSVLYKIVLTHIC